MSISISEAIARIDSLKHNTYSALDKIEWLSRVDSMVKRLIVDTHEGADNVTFSGYDENTDVNTELLVPAPFDEVYLRWMEAQIDYHNGDYGKYNNAIQMYNTSFEAYRNYYNREHMPIGTHIKYF